MSQLIECPSIYELMACQKFQWQHNPLLEIWRERQDGDGNSRIILESYPPTDSSEIFKEALSSNSVGFGLFWVQLDLRNFRSLTQNILLKLNVPVKFKNLPPCKDVIVFLCYINYFYFLFSVNGN